MFAASFLERDVFYSLYINKKHNNITFKCAISNNKDLLLLSLSLESFRESAPEFLPVCLSFALRQLTNESRPSWFRFTGEHQAVHCCGPSRPHFEEHYCLRPIRCDLKAPLLSHSESIALVLIVWLDQIFGILIHSHVLIQSWCCVPFTSDVGAENDVKSELNIQISVIPVSIVSDISW